jgi:hypothetical protein
MTHMTLLTGPERRRRWSEDDRDRILAASFAPGAVVADVARQRPDVGTGFTSYVDPLRTLVRLLGGHRSFVAENPDR